MAEKKKKITLKDTMAMSPEELRKRAILPHGKPRSVLEILEDMHRHRKIRTPREKRRRRNLKQSMTETLGP